MGKVKKYVPKVGDVCEWKCVMFPKKIVMVVTPQTESLFLGNCYVCVDEYDMNNSWLCKAKNLTLIHRP